LICVSSFVSKTPGLLRMKNKSVRLGRDELSEFGVELDLFVVLAVAVAVQLRVEKSPLLAVLADFNLELAGSGGGFNLSPLQGEIGEFLFYPSLKGIVELLVPSSTTVADVDVNNFSRFHFFFMGIE